MNTENTTYTYNGHPAKIVKEWEQYGRTMVAIKYYGPNGSTKVYGILKSLLETK